MKRSFYVKRYKDAEVDGPDAMGEPGKRQAQPKSKGTLSRNAHFKEMKALKKQLEAEGARREVDLDRTFEATEDFLTLAQPPHPDKARVSYTKAQLSPLRNPRTKGMLARSIVGKEAEYK